MPKQKTHSGAKKRFSVTANGLYKRGHSAHSHLLTKKSRKRKRDLRSVAYVDETRTGELKKLLPYL
ncbi:MAG: 50S ribosomal protein L35 [Clostridia bacterium]